MTIGIIGFFLLFLALRVPVAITLGLATTLYITLFSKVPITVVAQQMLSSIDKFTLMAIPFFIIAGGLMETGGISQKIVNFSKALVGSFPGGMALVMVISTAMFAGMTGSGVADAAAIGSVLIPAMVRLGYNVDFAGALQATSGILGPLIPPSILAVLYGVAVGVSVGDMLLAGVIPGLVMAVAIMIAAYITSVKRGYKSEGKFSFGELWRTFREAIWALLAPIIIMGGIYSGVFTPTEAAAVACLYSLIVGLFVYKELKPRDVLPVLYRSGILAASVMLIVSTSAAFSWILTREGLPQLLANWFMSISTNHTVFLIAISILLLVVGCLLDAAPAVLILSPILTPVAVKLGISPIHFGVVMITCMSIGLIHPPVGLNIMVISSITNRPVHKIFSEMWWFLATVLVVLLLIILIPEISTYLPKTLTKH